MNAPPLRFHIFVPTLPCTGWHWYKRGFGIYIQDYLASNLIETPYRVFAVSSRCHPTIRDFCMLRRLSRQSFNECIGDRERRRALAFAIFLKDRFHASVIKDWSYRTLSRITGLAPGTCQARVRTLRDMRLTSEWVRNGHPYLRVLSLRSEKSVTQKGRVWNTRKYTEVDFAKIDRTSVKSIEEGLMALLIVETQSKKNYIRQQTVLASGFHPNATQKEIQRAKRKQRMLCGGKSFSDNGFSIKAICRRLKCTAKTAKHIICKGEDCRMFEAHFGSQISEDWVLRLDTTIPKGSSGYILSHKRAIFYSCTKFSLCC